MKLANINPNKILIFLLHSAFFLTGISTVFIGQILPVLSNRLTLSDAQAGQLFISQFSGSFLGVFIFNYTLKKFGFIKTIVFGLGIMTIGVWVLNSETIELCFLGFFLNGIGIGTTLPSINMVIAELNPLRQTSALNILNFFWGVGAIISQPFVKIIGTEKSIIYPTIIISLFLLIHIPAILFSSTKFIAGETSFEQNSTEKPPRIWNNPVAWMIGIFNFLLVGIESGLGGWLTTYSLRFSEGKNQLFAATPIFFLFFVIGRGCAPLFSKFLNDNKYILYSLLVLLTGIILALLSNSFYMLVISAAILGFGTSATFPTNMARFTKFFGETATRNSTPIFVLGSLGGASINWLIGFTSTASESLKSGIFILLICCIFQILIQIYLNRKIT
jgi:fucose permease